jgi:hypothetical protein
MITLLVLVAILFDCARSLAASLAEEQRET